MKLLVNRESLVEALGYLRDVVKVRTPKPALTCVRMIAAGKTLELLATDCEIAIRWRLNQVEVQAEGEALIPVERLISVATSANSEALTIESGADAEIVVKSNDGRFKIMGYDVKEHPPIDAFTEFPSDIRIAGGTLANLIGRTRFAAASEPTRYAINGLQLRAESNRITLAATNGHRLSIASEKGSFEPVYGVVPSRAVTILERLCGMTDTQCRLQVKTGVAMIAFTGADSNVYAVLRFSMLEGNFPEYDDLVNGCGGTVTSVDRERLIAALKQANLFTTEESKGIRLSFTRDLLTVSGRGSQIGEAVIDVPCEYAGEQFDIGFNPAYLLDYLGTVDADRVKMELKSPNKPVRFTGDAGVVYIAMPLHLI